MAATNEAAYCSACGAYVFVASEGGCAHGHPRSSLRSVYFAEVDKRTGLPKPPARAARSWVTPFAPVAPIVAAGMPSAVAVASGGACISAPIAPIATAPVAVAPAPAAIAPACAATAPVIAPQPAMAHGVPMHIDAVSSAIWPPAFAQAIDGVFARLISPPKGKHSAAVGMRRTGRGRHSAVVVRQGRRAAVATWVIASFLTACVAGLLVYL